MWCCTCSDINIWFQLHVAAGSDVRSSPKAMYNNVTIEELQIIANKVSTYRRWFIYVNLNIIV